MAGVLVPLRSPTWATRWGGCAVVWRALVYKVGSGATLDASLEQQTDPCVRSRVFPPSRWWSALLILVATHVIHD